MSVGLILVDLFALAAMSVGGFMVFRQKDLRNVWCRLTGRPPAPESEATTDGAHYALIIFGMMLFAFGLIIFAFFTSYALLT